MGHTLLVLIYCFLIGNYLLSRWLNYLNNKNWKVKLPIALSGIYDAEKYKKSQLYDKAEQKLSAVSGTVNLLIILTVLWFEGFAMLDSWVSSYTQNPVYQGLLFFGILFFISDIINLPFSIYSIFVIEEKFDFNKMTARTFIFDKLKGYLLAIIAGGAILALIIWFYSLTPEMFWLYAWILVTAFSLFIIVFYTSLIVPLFNKLQPVAEGALKDMIQSFCEKTDFKLKNIYTIDGSKRSTKSNAYFSGIGIKKSIVLYDTLLKDHSDEEIVSILAHEIGHYKKKHVLQGFVISTIQTGLLLFLLSWLLSNSALAGALGAENNNFHLGLLSFLLLYSPVSLILGLFVNMLTRKNEYQADHFAKEHYDAKYLIEALKKLSVNNLSNLNPHWLYVFFYYSHPPLLKRLKSLEQ